MSGLRPDAPRRRARGLPGGAAPRDRAAADRARHGHRAVAARQDAPAAARAGAASRRGRRSRGSPSSSGRPSPPRASSCRSPSSPACRASPRTPPSSSRRCCTSSRTRSTRCRRAAGCELAARRDRKDVVLAVTDTGRRHPGRGPGPGLRAAVHHEAARPRHRARPADRARDRRRPRRDGVAREPSPGAARPRSCACPRRRRRADGPRAGRRRRPRDLPLHERAARGARPRDRDRDVARRRRSPSLAASRFDLVVSDINLDARLDGLDLLRAFKRQDPDVEVVLISAFGTLETALEAVQAGAFDYVSKPVDIGQVRDVVERALARRARAGEPREPAFAPGRLAPDGLVGRSGAMLAVYKQIALACASDAPVLDHRRDRHRQGARGPRHPPPRPARRAGLRGRQLRRDPGGPPRVGAVRPRARARSRARWPTRRASSSRRTAARSSSTRSARCRRRCRCACCARSSSARCGRSARPAC